MAYLRHNDLLNDLVFMRNVKHINSVCFAHWYTDKALNPDWGKDDPATWTHDAATNERYAEARKAEAYYRGLEVYRANRRVWDA